MKKDIKDPRLLTLPTKDEIEKAFIEIPDETCCSCKDQLDQIITLLKEIKVKI